MNDLEAKRREIHRQNTIDDLKGVAVVAAPILAVLGGLYLVGGGKALTTLAFIAIGVSSIGLIVAMIRNRIDRIADVLSGRSRRP